MTPPTPPSKVLASYRINPVRTTAQPVAGGHATHAWRLTTPTGALLLRQLPPHLTDERAALVTTAHDQAARTGLAPNIILSEGGQRTATHGGRRYLLTRYLEHAHPLATDPTPGDCHRLGHLLGQLHHALATIPVPVGWRWRLGDDQALRDALDAHQPPHCPHPAARRVLATKRTWAAGITPATRNTLDTLNQQLIHGDIHPGNILISRDGQLTVIDFDLARPAPRSYELLRALLYCTHPAGPPQTYTPRVAAFLHGYLAAAPLGAQEIATMTTLYRAVQLLDPHGLHTCHNAPPSLLRFGHARFALLYWLRRHSPHLTNLAYQVSRGTPTT